MQRHKIDEIAKNPLVPRRYGLSFSFHATMHGKAMLETTIHQLPVYVMYMVVLAGCAELLLPHVLLPALLRVYGVLVLGSWFFHVAFVLYLPHPWPGDSRFAIISVVTSSGCIRPRTFVFMLCYLCNIGLFIFFI